MARFLKPKPVGLYRYGVEALDGDYMNLSFVDPVPRPLRYLNPRRGFGGGARVSDRNMPTKLVLERRSREVLDIDNALHMFMVSPRFIDLVSRFQSEFQTFPVECSWEDGTPAGEFFLFFTLILLDAVDRERTTATWRQVLPDGGLWQPKQGETFVFDKSRMRDVHMWVDPNMPDKGLLISEALYGALLDSGMQSFHKGLRYEEV